MPRQVGEETIVEDACEGNVSLGVAHSLIRPQELSICIERNNQTIFLSPEAIKSILKWWNNEE